jgi:hypothetical protein
MESEELKEKERNLMAQFITTPSGFSSGLLSAPSGT